MNQLRLVIPTIFITGLGAQAQALRCDLVQSTAACFDLDTLRNKTIVVPSNVTRLENEGIQLCQKSGTQGGNADIAYVYDNSGSMGGNSTGGVGNMVSWVGNADTIPGVDTLFYYGTGGCPSGSGSGGSNRSGTITIARWNTLGTATANVTVPRLISRTGCNQPAGDPYNARGRAYRLGIQNQGLLAPSSMAGIMSFATTVGNIVRPLIMSPANVTTVTNGINANANGSTYYDLALDTAVAWLRTASITPQTAGRTKAIIFLSDGAPTNLNYLPLDPATPPVYGIFLGRDTVGTGRLRELSALTGGIFYLIPPNRPDSLNTVISNILNIILVQQNPQALTITNTLIPQGSTATLTFDSTTNPDVWRVRLDSVIALRPSTANTMRVISSYQKIEGGVPTIIVIDTINFTLSTTGAAAGGNGNVANTTFSTRCYPASKIQWQAISTGSKPAFFTESDSLNIRLRLRTSSSDSTDLSFLVNNSTRRNGDAEIGNMPRLSFNIDSALFTGNVLTRAAATATGFNSVLEPYYFDSLIAFWTHPRDPQDVARDTIRFQSANINAAARFSATPGGASPPGNLFPNTTTQVCMVVEDNRRNPAYAYQGKLSSYTSGPDSVVSAFPAISGDVQVSPGIFSFSVCANVVRGVKVGGDTLLQVAVVGDSLRATYSDPVYGDIAIATARYEISVEEAASIAFTDNAYAPILGNSAANPVLLSQTPVYLRYQDDVGIPALGDQTVQISVRSLKSGVQTALDQEPLTLLNSGAVTLSVTLKEWRGSIPLAEALAVAAGNGILQGAWLVEITATVQSHSNSGASTGNISAVLYAANPNAVPTLTFIDSVNATTPEGPVDVQFTLTDQDFVTNSATESLLATALCPASGDSVAGIVFAQTSPGVYTSTWLQRDGLGSPNFTNNILSCPAGGDLTLRYVDPVYGTVTNFTVREAAMPVATPATSSFVSQTSTALSSSTAGSAINYTLNSSLPRPGQPLLYSAALPLIATTTIKAVASATGYLRSRVMTEVYTHTPLPSRIQILDSLGNIPAGNTITDAATRVLIRVETSQGGLATVVANLVSTSRGDAEAPIIGNHVYNGTTTHTYNNTIAMLGNAGSATAANGTLETGYRDTLIATWTNPSNPGDVVRDTIYVVPAFVATTVHFSATLGGSAIAQYASGTATGYVVVTARTLPGGYSVRVTSSTNATDVETYPLALVSPGVYSVAVPFNYNVKTNSDGSIQIFPAGDVLQARFIHPVFLDTTFGNATYAPAVEVTAQLQFLDTNGAVLAQDALFSPANNRVIVRYTDDWFAQINANVNPKSLIFVLNAYRGTALLGTDRDTVAMAYNGTSGYWEGVYALRDRALLSGNDTVESQFRGLLSATALSHNTAGVADGNSVEARLVIAYPDQAASIQITAAGGGAVSRATAAIAITLNDQAHTRVPGAQVAVTLSCLASGDRQDTLWLSGNGAGTYSLASHPKDEELSGSPTLNNGALACRASDSVRVTYVDPVFGTTASTTVGWIEPTGVTLRFGAASDSSTITSIADTVASTFLAIAQGSSPTRNLIDTLLLRMTTPQGDLETFPAVETAVNSGIFVASIPYGFVSTVPVAGNGTVNVQRSLITATTSVVGTGLVRLGVDSAQAQITMVSVEEPASMTFTDAAYSPLLGNSQTNPWTLSQSPVYLRYRDDNGTPAVGPVTVQFAVRSIKSGATVGSENDSLSMSSTVMVTPTLKEWRGSIPLAEVLAAVNNNGILQGAWMVEIIATVQSHNNAGVNTGTLLDTLYAANPNTASTLTFIDSANATTPEGASDVQFTIADQDFIANSTADTVYATAICAASGDSVSALVFTQSSPGNYTSEWLIRDALVSPNFTNRILSCPAGANVTLAYADPVYGTISSFIVPEAIMPVAVPVTSTFVSQTSVVLSTTTSGAAINYTTNSSLPRPGQPQTYSTAIPLIATTTIKAVASASGYLRSRVMTEAYTRTPLPSRIQILDSMGNIPANNTITDATTRLKILVETSQGGLATVTANLVSNSRGDAENPTLGNHVYSNSTTHSYDNTIAMIGNAGAAATLNGSLETGYRDTLIATWTNPSDPGDVVRDTIYVVPAFAASEVYFSATSGGPRMAPNQYLAGTTTGYIVVRARSLPGSYVARVVTSANASDTESYVLSLVSPGVYSTAFPIDINVKVIGNGASQVFPAGDQLDARFIHPIFLDTVYGNSGYAQAPEDVAVIQFLDTAGMVLPQDALFSPANNRVIVRYDDDWSPPIDGFTNINPKTLTFVLQAYQGTTLLGTDRDTVTLSYIAGPGYWQGTYPLRDRALIPGNDTVESQFRGLLSATSAPHNNAGVVTGAPVEARLVIAYPDQGANIQITAAGGGSVSRATPAIAITLNDQAHTRVSGVQIAVTLSCLASGDRQDTVWLTGNGAGVYSLSSHPKDEELSGSPTINNGALACRASDSIRVSYVDPVFGTTASTTVGWAEPTGITLRFGATADSSTITSVVDTVASNFLAIAQGSSPTRNLRDTIFVRMTTPQGELENFPAVETAVNSGIFVASIPYAFATIAPVTGNGTVNVQRSTVTAATSVVGTGLVRLGTDSAQAQIAMISVEEPASMTFTDATYSPLVGNSQANPWLLSQTPVYLRYRDDNGTPAIGPVTVQFTVRSLKSGQSVGSEIDSLAMSTTVFVTQTLKEWRGSIPLAEALAAVSNNGILQGAWMLEIIATVQSHSNMGAATGALRDTLYAANPNTVPTLTFIDSANATAPEGPSDVRFTLADQDFVTNSTVDSLYATAICAALSDTVSNILFIQTSPGNYTSEWLLRDAQVVPNLSNRMLSCPAGSDLTLSYADPVYGTVSTFIVPEAAMPVALPATSTFVSQTSVALSTTTSGAGINYTVNSSLPRPGQPQLYSSVIPLIATTTVKAVASAPGYLRSRVMTEVYTRNPLPSRIQILDSLGNVPVNNTITDAATRLQIRVETSQGGLTTVTANLTSISRVDAEAPSLGNHVYNGSTTHTYNNTIAMAGNAGSATASNGTLETGYRDTLLAVWRNPTDTNDIVRDTIYVVPAFRASTVYFSATLGGSQIATYPAGTTSGYVVVNARPLPGAYAIRVVSSTNASDTESYALTQVTPGIYSVAVPINTALKISANGTLQIFPAGDQLQARFIHPVFGDTVFGNATIAPAPEVAAQIQFLDTNGVVLAQDALYSPANQRVIVRYSDDWSAQINGFTNVNPKTLYFVLNAYRGTALLGTDRDTVTVTRNGTSGFWEGTYQLRDRFPIPGNDTVESQFRGLLSATVRSHSVAGVSDTTTLVARLIIAYPDQSATLQITAAGGGVVGRATPAISITLNDQAHTRVLNAQVAVSVTCLASTDRQDTLWLSGNGAGVYSVASHIKDEQLAGIPTFNNGALACRASDSIRVTYVDPVFGTTASAMVGWVEITGVTLRFAAASDSSTITSVSDTVASRFLAIAQGSSPTRNLIDTLLIRLTTPQGELENFPAVETAVNSGIFIASLPFAFSNLSPVTANGTVNVQISTTSSATSVVGTGLVRLGVDSAQAQIALLSVEEPASMTFTDASYNPLTGNSQTNPWALTQSPVFIRYRDDNGTPAMGPVTVRFAVRSIKSGLTVGSEADTLSLSTTVFVTQTLKEWRGSIPLAEALAALNNNGVLQGAWLVEIIARVQSHSNKGVLGGFLLDTLYAANPNAAASISFISRTNTVAPEGPADVQIILRDQDFVRNSAGDSLLVTVICESSGDSVTGIRLSQDSAGLYRSEWVTRTNTVPPSLTDRILSCPTNPGGEGLIVRYVDPVFDTTGGVWVIPEAARPLATPASTSFPSQIQVALTDATPGSSINFTLNGTLPQAGAAASTYRAPIDLLATTTLKAIGSAPGYLPSPVLTQTYTFNPLPSRITFLDMNGSPIPGRQITDAATSLQLRVETSQGGLASVSPILNVRASRDLDTLMMSSRIYTGSQNIYSAPIALKGGDTSISIGNDTLETRLPDTLIAVWRNPLNPLDVVADTLIIVPAFVQSSIHFSATAGGPPLFSGEYSAGTTTGYVVVNTRSLPGLTYRVLVISSTGSLDTAYFNLTEIAGRPGVFSSPIPLDPSRPKTVGNSVIEVLNSGDQLRATFISPVFGPPSVSAFAGYGQAAQQPGVLSFFDTLGNVLTATSVFSPANRRVILRYSDDWSAQINSASNINPKQLTFRLEAYQGTTLMGLDSESVSLVYDTSFNAWTGIYPLRDRAFRLDNDTVESQFRGELTATVSSHDNSGAPDGSVQASIIIAYPDQAATIVVTAQGGGSVGRFTSGIVINIQDQPHTLVSGATITSTVTCEVTGDVETVTLVGNGNGGYTISPPLPKNESPPNTVRSGDSVLTCRDADAVIVTYLDPVYSTPTVVRVPWAPSTGITLSFTAMDSSTISSVNYPTAVGFRAVVMAATTTLNQRDTLYVRFTTSQGELDSFPAVETGNTTGVYVAVIPFSYTSALPSTNNGIVEAQIITSSGINSVLATGRVVRGADTATTNLTLNSGYNRSQLGYVRDRDGDGAADQVVLVFDRKLFGTPASLDSLFWASEGSNRRAASGSSLTLSADSLSLIANVIPFPQNLTGIPAGARPPLALLPNDAYYGGNDVPLADSVGPVPVSARKLPSSLVTNAQGIYPPDTILISVSERIRTIGSGFDSVFTFSTSSNCSDSTSTRLPIPTLSITQVSDTLFTLIISNVPGTRIPLKGNCIYMERGGRFRDYYSNNVPGKRGVPLDGNDPLKVLRDVVGYPSVVPGSGGLGTSNPTNDPRYLVYNGTLQWLSPADWGTAFRNGQYNPNTSFSIRDSVNPNLVESGTTGSLTPFPNGISSLLVITSSRYIAHINIYDHYGHWVRTMKQAFGFQGEMNNVNRRTNSGVMSWLVWDNYDSQGQKAGQGVYIWKVTFELLDNKQEVRVTRTGLLRGN